MSKQDNPSHIYRLLVGFEHIATGAAFRIDHGEDPDVIRLAASLVWTLESPSVFRVECTLPFYMYHQCTSNIVHASVISKGQLDEEQKQKLFNKNIPEYPDASAGEYEYYAQVVSAALRKLDAESYPELCQSGAPPVSKTVVRAVRSAHRSNANSIIRSLRYDSQLKCWYYYWASMTVGVEPDGHMHT